MKHLCIIIWIILKLPFWLQALDVKVDVYCKFSYSFLNFNIFGKLVQPCTTLWQTCTTLHHFMANLYYPVPLYGKLVKPAPLDGKLVQPCTPLWQTCTTLCHFMANLYNPAPLYGKLVLPCTTLWQTCTTLRHFMANLYNPAPLYGLP